MTQYRLQPIRGGGGFLSVQQCAQLCGEHHRKHSYQHGQIYVAGIGLAGEAEEAEDTYLRALKPRQDSTVVTIGELDFTTGSEMMKQPQVKIVERYRWTGRKHSVLYPQLVDILKNV